MGIYSEIVPEGGEMEGQPSVVIHQTFVAVRIMFNSGEHRPFCL